MKQPLLLMVLVLVSLAGWAQETPTTPEALQRALKDPQGTHVLDLASLGLEQLPPEVGQLNALTSLSLNENHLSALPDSLGNLTHLEVLWLAGNQIHSFGPLSRLKALKNLDLARNGLAQVPVELVKLSNLEQISLRENRILVFPPSFFRLEKLQVLDLSLNDLKSLPVEIKDLKALKVLDLSANPIPDPEREKLKAALPNVDVIF